MYKQGELLPPEFTERDRFRNLYPSRIGIATQEELDELVEQAFKGAPSQTGAPIVQSGEIKQEEAKVALTGNVSANATSKTTGTNAPVAPSTGAQVTAKK